MRYNRTAITNWLAEATIPIHPTRLDVVLSTVLAATVPSCAPLAGAVENLRDAALPTVPFDRDNAPSAPDYTGPVNWASLPSIRDDGDMTPVDVPAPPQLRAPADVFFIHPSVPMPPGQWNADTADVDINGLVGQTAIRNQASVFNGCCAIYAPRYRQAAPGSDIRRSDDSAAATELAYSDILRAFREFRRRVGDRPFILAGHRQGAQLGRLLVEREIDGSPIARQMVAAYLIGQRIEREWVTGLRDIRQCTAAADTNCIVTWSTFAEGSQAAHSRGDRPKAAPHRYLCINPVSWAAGTAIASRRAHLGAWMRNGLDRPEPPRAPDTGLVDMRCGEDGALYISPPGKRYADLASPGGDYRNLDYQIAWMNLRANAADRVAAFLAHGR